ncbi:MAG: DUF4199 domain-containing protein [Crocinitomicaceae bacterium]|nr:DUF4199 domain-containing protein [Crocinitomicaceae bacterium]
MRITVKIGLLFAAIWIGLKMVLFATQVGASRYDLTVPILTNILCLLLAISIGLYLHKSAEKEYTNALGDIKNGLSAGVPYIIIVSVFLYFYYTKIDPEYNQHQRSEAAMQLEKLLDDPDDLQKMRDSNAEFEVMSVEEIRESIISNQEAMYSPQAVTTISLLGMLILATFNSIFITIIYRKLIFRQAPPPPERQR